MVRPPLATVSALAGALAAVVGETAVGWDARAALERRARQTARVAVAPAVFGGVALALGGVLAPCFAEQIASAVVRSRDVRAVRPLPDAEISAAFIVGRVGDKSGRLEPPFAPVVVTQTCATVGLSCAQIRQKVVGVGA